MQFRKKTKPEVFDYLLLSDFLKDLKKPRDKVAALIEEDKIVRLKKGLYVFGENWRNSPLSLEMMANIIYGPSCVSLEFALTHYGLISERSTVITSVAIGDSKVIHTPVGIFEYRAMPPEKFKVGIEYQDLGEEGGYFIASREKAIADLVYRTPHIHKLEDLRYYLFEEMRVDEELFRELNFKKLNEIAAIYNKNSIYMIGRL